MAPALMMLRTGRIDNAAMIFLIELI